MDSGKATKAVICGLLLIVLATGVFLVSAYRAPIYAELNALKLIPEATPFTELYFEDASALPTKIVPNKPFSFAFTIHNVEGETTTYPYTSYIEYPSGAESVFAQGTVVLSSNASTTITIQNVFKTSNQGAEVVVKLTSLNQQIDFHLTGDN